MKNSFIKTIHAGNSLLISAAPLGVALHAPLRAVQGNLQRLPSLVALALFYRNRWSMSERLNIWLELYGVIHCSLFKGLVNSWTPDLSQLPQMNYPIVVKGLLPKPRGFYSAW